MGASSCRGRNCSLKGDGEPLPVEGGRFSEGGWGPLPVEGGRFFEGGWGASSCRGRKVL